MSFGAGNSGYLYANEAASSLHRGMGIVSRVIGFGVLAVFGWVAWSLSGAGYNAKLNTQLAAIESQGAGGALRAEASAAEAAAIDPSYASYLQFSETYIGLQACSDMYYERYKKSGNRNDKTYLHYRKAVNAYMSQNRAALDAVSQRITMRAAQGLAANDFSALHRLPQDMIMLTRPRGGDPAKIARYDELAARGQNQSWCNATLGKVSARRLDIKI